MPACSGRSPELDECFDWLTCGHPVTPQLDRLNKAYSGKGMTPKPASLYEGARPQGPPDAGFVAQYPVTRYSEVLHSKLRCTASAPNILIQNKPFAMEQGTTLKSLCSSPLPAHSKAIMAPAITRSSQGLLPGLHLSTEEQSLATPPNSAAGDTQPSTEDQHETKLQACWDKSIAKHMNFWEGYRDVHVLMVKWADEIDELKVIAEV